MFSLEFSLFLSLPSRFFLVLRVFTFISFLRPHPPLFLNSNIPHTSRSPGAGYDQIDIPACTAAGIQVSHTPTAVDAATADTALFLLLGALRLFNAPLHALRAGKWRGGPPAPPLAHDPEGKVLGILGMGGIGRELKKKVEVALGMKVQYHNRRELDPKLAAGARYVSFEDLLATSDVISLNLPLNVSSPFRGLNPVCPSLFLLPIGWL